MKSPSNNCLEYNKNLVKTETLCSFFSSFLLNCISLMNLLVVPLVYHVYTSAYLLTLFLLSRKHNTLIHPLFGLSLKYLIFQVLMASVRPFYLSLPLWDWLYHCAFTILCYQYSYTFTVLISLHVSFVVWALLACLFAIDHFSFVLIN